MRFCEKKCHPVSYFRGRIPCGSVRLINVMSFDSYTDNKSVLGFRFAFFTVLIFIETWVRLSAPVIFCRTEQFCNFNLRSGLYKIINYIINIRAYLYYICRTKLKAKDSFRYFYCYRGNAMVTKTETYVKRTTPSTTGGTKFKRRLHQTL